MKAEMINEIIAVFLNCQPSPRFKLNRNELGLDEMEYACYPFYTESIDLLLPAIIKIMASDKKLNLLSFFITIDSNDKSEKIIMFDFAKKVASIIIEAKSKDKQH